MSDKFYIPNEYNSDNNELYSFTPTQDISVYEVACIIKLISIQVSEEIFNDLPEELKKHFRLKE